MAKDSFLYEKVYRDLKEKISQGILKEGDKLDAEEDMVKQYQVSAITIKKALALLVQERLVERVRGRGSFVTGSAGKEAEEPVQETVSEPIQEEKLIGVIFEHISSSYGLQLLYEMDHQVRKAGYHLIPVFLMEIRNWRNRALPICGKLGRRVSALCQCMGHTIIQKY